MSGLGSPPGFLWLLRHELRVLWRGSILVRTHRHVLVPVLAVGVVFQAVALVLAWWITRYTLAGGQMLLAANINLIVLGLLMLSRGITAAIDVLYGRGDVDFLLASPLDPGHVLACRMLGIAVSVAAPWLLLTGVLANGLAVFGQVWALAAYPVVLAEGLVVAAVSLTLVVGLVGRLGPARARRLGHMLSLLVGVGIFVLGQAPRFVAKAKLAAFWSLFLPARGGGGVGFMFARALTGQLPDLAATLALAALVFGVVWRGLAGPFAHGAISAAAYRPPGRRSAQGGRFRGGVFRALFAKEVRQLARYPGMVTQVVYRSLTLVPVLLILAGRFDVANGIVVAVPLLVFLAGQLGLFFISVLRANDLIPDLAASSPAAGTLARRAEIAASAHATLLVLALPALAVLVRAPSLAGVLALGLAGGLLCNLVLGQRLPIPLPRPGLGKSQSGSVLGLILGVAASSAWAFGVWLLAAPDPLAWLHH
ncbi:hypothetical protein [Acidocella sp.]|uniref:hypothetical protein n=1 Tax=Acidocella sp. TaxID=50710 RepID=UPI00260AB996|nr:hypothetical protein [Acidocella sp.]